MIKLRMWDVVSQAVLPCVMIIVLHCASGNGMAAQEVDWGQRLRTEAPKVWDEYRERARSLSLQYTRKQWHRTLPAQFPTEPTAIWEIKRNPSATRLLFVITNSSYSGCWGLNDKYAFELTRKKLEDPWIIKNIFKDLSKTDEIKSACYNLHLDKGGPSFPPPIELHEYGPLSGLVAEDGFSVQKWTDQSHDGRQLIRYDFICSRDPNDARYLGRHHWQRGWFIVEPARFWRLLEYEASVDYGAVNKVTTLTHGVLDCVELPQGIPVAKNDRVELRAKGIFSGNPKGPMQEVEWEKRTEYTIQPRDCPVTEFTLTAFGFSEPPGVEWKGPTSWWLWGILTAGVLFIIAVFVGYWKQRLA
jgi:hypothetical protein